MEISGNLRIIFVLGCPAAGKGTHCPKIASGIGFFHLSVGDYLRDLANPVGGHSEQAFGGIEIATLQRHIKDRILVPPEQIVKILLYKIKHEQGKGFEGFLIDGFPRDIVSAALFEQSFQRPDAVYLFQCPKVVAAGRFKTRDRDKERPDEIFRQRYEEFEKSSPAVIKIYRDYGILKVFDTSDIDCVRQIGG